MKIIGYTDFKKTFLQFCRTHKCTCGKVKNRQQGFTLLELLLAVVVFLIVMGAVFQLLKLATIERNTVNVRVDSMKAARIAVNYMRRDILSAGLSYHNIGGNIPDNWSNLRFDTTADGDNDRDLLTSIVASNNTGNNLLDPSSPTDGITIVTRRLAVNREDPEEMKEEEIKEFESTSADGSHVLVKVKGGTSACKLYDVYLFETETSQIVGMVTSVVDANNIQLGFGDPLGVNQSATGSGNSKSLLIGTGTKGTFKKINIINFSVINGTLIRRTFGNRDDLPATEQIDTHELIYDVQNMQIRYLLDDGSVTDDPSLGNNGRINQQKMNGVINVEIDLKVLEPDNSQMITVPINIKEIVSTRNLRYTIE